MPPTNPNKKTMSQRSLKKQQSSSKPKTHIHFHSDEEDDLVMSNLLESEDVEAKGSDGESNLEQDSNKIEEDEAPEVISTAVSKRDVIEKDNLRKEFQKSIQIAKKKANKARDQKLKQSKAQSKSKLKPIQPKPSSSSSSSSSSSDEESETEPKSTSIQPIQSNKKYLDPSLFVTASKILKESKRSAEEREQNRIASIQKKRKRSNLSEQEDRREIGNNTTIVRLKKSNHLIPIGRPKRIIKFVQNRLSYIKNQGSHHKLPKLTLNVKSQMGTRKRSSSISDFGKRKINRPAILFVREPKKMN